MTDYLDRVEQALVALENIDIERYAEEILTSQRVILRIRIRFGQGCLLELNEAIIVESNTLVWLDYRYHCQDEQNCLIFRYDSTPHFPDLPTFPHHKHLPSRVIASQKPDITEVLQEAVALEQDSI